MKKILTAGVLVCLLLLSACGAGQAAQNPPRLQVLATTYPVYLFATAVTEGVEGVEVSLLVNQQTSCLHDYTLTVNDMKAIEGADVIVQNGVGLEDFMSDALAASDAAVIDCAQSIALLTLPDGEDDPHIWLDPDRAQQMVQNIRTGLEQIDPDYGETYRQNAQEASLLLYTWQTNLRDILTEDENMAPQNRNLITFHDGFQYFAEAFDFTIVKAIEEEEGSEASAQEIVEICNLIDTYQIPVIFTEVNGSDATAKAIGRERDVTIGQLNMMMSGQGSELSAYLDAQLQNAAAIVNGFAGQEVLTV